MEITAYTKASAFEELRADWNPLLRRAPLDHVFYTWEWQKTWWDAYRPGDLRILACHHEGQLLGIAPLFIAAPDGKRTLQIIGCVDVTDYLDFIVNRAELSAVFTAFADYFAASRDDYDSLDFCNIPYDSPTKRILPGLLQERGFSTSVDQQEVCPIIELPKDWPGYLSMLDKKQRHELRRKIRRVQGSEKAIDWYIVNGRHDLAEEVTHFVRLMAASDPEKAEFLRNNNNLRFFRKIVPLLQDCGWLQLNFLTVDDERAAAYINFVYGDRVMVYNSGHDHHDFADLSPGIVLLAYNIRYAIEQGFQTYDFLRGDEPYKYRMGGRDNPVMNIRAC